jgi:hypothetical protein
MVHRMAATQLMWRARWSLITPFLLALASPVAAQVSYTPDSPAVRRLMDRAANYLRSDSMAGHHASQLGGRALIGLAIYKYELRYASSSGRLPPRTLDAVDRVRKVASSVAELGKLDNYSLAISLIFLAEVAGSDGAQEISLLLAELAGRQLPNGPWTYKGARRGDTSQTQYAVLGAWAAKSAGVQAPRTLMDGVTNWLIRTQTPDGAWGYHASDPGNFIRVTQTQVRPTMGVAGVGSLYVAADFLGMQRRGKPGGLSDGRLPPAVVPVVEDVQRRRQLVDSAVDLDLLKQAINDGDDWVRAHFTVRPSMYPFYHLYSLERYYSFREMLEGKPVTQPRWYDEGIRMMMEFQEPAGSFHFPVTTSADRPVGTAFAMLFALRGTQETIARVEGRDGVLRGGYGLPSDLSEARLKGGQIVAPAITGEVNDMVAMLEAGESEQIENLLENPEALILDRVGGDDRGLVDRLTRLARTGSYETRIIAVRALGRQGNLDNIPILIYALTDPDPRVIRQARDGLRLTSRKFGGFGLPDRPSEEDVKIAVGRWKDWYRSIRPDATFVE